MTTSYKISPTGANSFDSTTLDSLNSFSINKQSESTQMGSDGKPIIQLITTSNIYHEVSVEGKDVGINLEVGNEGSLVLIAVGQEGGTGVATAGKTFTWSQAVCTGTDSTINHSGESVATYTFQCYSSDGDLDPLAIT